MFVDNNGSTEPQHERLNMKLPTVLDYLVKEELQRAKFVKPALGKELEALHEEEASILAIRRMTLAPCMVVPVHMHEKKEKLYILVSPGVLRVVMDIGSRHCDIYMDLWDELIIPAGCPHCLSYFPGIPVSCNVIVVASSRDSNDIQWEEGAELLIRNDHLKKA